MTILDRANAFIGHEQEVDEGYETTMRRNAFIAGFKEALELVERMREAQWAFDMITGEEDIEYIDMMQIAKREAEREVDEYLKKMEEQRWNG